MIRLDFFSSLKLHSCRYKQTSTDTYDGSMRGGRILYFFGSVSMIFHRERCLSVFVCLLMQFKCANILVGERLRLPKLVQHTLIEKHSCLYISISIQSFVNFIDQSQTYLASISWYLYIVMERACFDFLHKIIFSPMSIHISSKLCFYI